MRRRNNAFKAKSRARSEVSRTFKQPNGAFPQRPRRFRDPDSVQSRLELPRPCRGPGVNRGLTYSYTKVCKLTRFFDVSETFFCPIERIFLINYDATFEDYLDRSGARQGRRAGTLSVSFVRTST